MSACSDVSDFFATPWTVAPSLLCPWNSPGKNTEVSSLSLPQGTFMTQGSNLGLLHCRQLLYHLSHLGKLFITFIKKAECQRIYTFELWCWRRLLRVPCRAKRSNQTILKEINPEYSLEGLMLKLKLQYFGHQI